MRSVSAALELLYWDVPAKLQIKRIQELEDAQWHTHHCKLGWYAKGILQASGNEHTVFSIDVTADRRLMAVSSCDGGIKLLHFPCVNASACARVTTGHSPLVTKVRFSNDAQTILLNDGRAEIKGRLISLGGKDQSILQWRLLQTTLHPHVQLLVSKAAPDKPLYEVPQRHRIKTAMYKSFSRLAEHDKPPNSHLELDFVHGYGGHNNNANLFVVASGELLYNAGALCVIFDPLARSQLFFREHQNDVMAMCVCRFSQMKMPNYFWRKTWNFIHN